MLHSVAYDLTAVLMVGGSGSLCVAARRHPGRWRTVAAWCLGAVLLVVAGAWVQSNVASNGFRVADDLPLALCNMGVIVAAAACFTRQRHLVELTWFWGLAGTLQGLVTPDLNVAFPHLVFFEYVLGHATIVAAALFLVIGLRIEPGRWAVVRVMAITIAYTAVVGLVDWLADANYMFLRAPPSNWTLLRVLGPWPWYIASAAGVALVLVTALDAPFWRHRRRSASAGQR